MLKLCKFTKTITHPPYILLFLFSLGMSLLSSSFAFSYGDDIKGAMILNENLPDANIRNQIIYFVIPDRFNNGDPTNDYGGKDPSEGVLVHGYDPSNRAMYHGGDLEGLEKKLNYIDLLGATAIWTTPVMGNKTIQFEGEAGYISGAHGFWVIDFMNVDSHFGTNDDFSGYVEQAQRKGLKVILDILANHTADVIGYAECGAPPASCPYIPLSSVPYFDSDGNAFDPNEFEYAFRDDAIFPDLSVQSFPYTPVIPDMEKNIKNPTWLNDPVYYHNRGIFGQRESIYYGDLFRLDDLFTEHPRVVRGLIDIYSHWINTYGIDGYRLDAARHVQPSFWQQWRPAIETEFRRNGKNDFMMFGEIFDARQAELSRFTGEATLPQVLDFGFQSAAEAVFSSRAPTSVLQELFAADDYYIDPDSNAYFLPTFLGNHDMGRIGAFIRRDNPNASEDELLARSRLAHAFLFLARGIPVVYYGDEQGFTGLVNGSTNFEAARQDMFASQTPEYMNPEYNQQIGSDTTPAVNNFDRQHPLYRAIGEFAFLRQHIEELRQGAQIHRYASDDSGGGVYAFSRFTTENRSEVLAVINTSTEPRTVSIDTWHNNTRFFQQFPKNMQNNGLEKQYLNSDVASEYDKHANEGQSEIHDSHPQRISTSDANGVVSVEIPALDFVLLQAHNRLPERATAPQITISEPENNIGYGVFWVRAELSEDTFGEVSFYARVQGSEEFEYIGTDDNAPYRINYDGAQHPLGTEVEFRTVVRDYSGNRNSSPVKRIVIENRLRDVTVIYENGNNRQEVLLAMSNGVIDFPQAVSPDGYTFTWPENSEEVSLLFGTEISGLFSYDLPITLRLNADVIPNAMLVPDGLEAVLYVNNDYEVSDTNNFGEDDLPESFPFDPAAPNPLAFPVYIRGTMNGWGLDDELVYQGSYNFSDDVTFSDSGQYLFKFADASWSLFNYGAGFNPDTGLNGGGSFNDISITIPEGEAGIYDVTMFAYPNLNGGTVPYVFYRLEQE